MMWSGVVFWNSTYSIITQKYEFLFYVEIKIFIYEVQRVGLSFFHILIKIKLCRFFVEYFNYCVRCILSMMILKPSY